MRNDFPQITKGKGLRIPHSGFRIPDSIPSTNSIKTWWTVNRLLSHLRLVKTIAKWKTVIESMQSLFRVASTRFLAFYSDNLSGLHDGETTAKWQSKASFATHPSTKPAWLPKLLTRFSS